MPLFLYRVHPALAVAFGAVYRPGEWLYSLRARSQATAVDLRLSAGQVESLRRALDEAVRTTGGRFPADCIAACPYESALLHVPFDLEAGPSQWAVRRAEGRRLLGVEARGYTDGFPFLAEIWGTVEQWQALARQIEAAQQVVASRCPQCGADLGPAEHVCA